MTPLEQLLESHSEVFHPELGTLKGVQVRLEVKPEAKPRFHKPRAQALCCEGEHRMGPNRL